MGTRKNKKRKTLSDDKNPIITAAADPVSGFGLWDGLSPQLMTLISARIPTDEFVRSVPLVCKSWRDFVNGPCFCNDIDVERWCRRCKNSDRIDAVVRKLVDRSKGTINRFSGYKLGKAGFSSIANCGRFLKELRIPRSDVTDKAVNRFAESLTMLTVLDISYCLKVTCQGLEALGKHCKYLVQLKRNMPPPEWMETVGGMLPKTDNGEAMVIADTMQGLFLLELGYGRLGDPGLDAILTNCRALTHLDIHGCWGVNFEGDLVEKCYQIGVLKSPWDNDYYDAHSSDDDNGDGAVCSK